jgi:hypothetical protein
LPIRFPEKFFLNGGDLAVGIKSQRKDWTGQRFGRDYGRLFDHTKQAGVGVVV